MLACSPIQTHRELVDAARRPLLAVCVLTVSFWCGTASARECNVRDFGATGRKGADAQRAFQRAIDTCARAGGGRVYVPPGTYTSGPIELRSRVRLYLEAGAVLSPNLNPKVWRARAGAGSEDAASTGYGKLALLYGDKVSQVSIEGPGVIDGQASYGWETPRAPDPFIATETESARAFGASMRRPYPKEPLVSTLVLNGARDVVIRDVTMVRARSWTLHLWDCERVVIDGVRIDNSLTEGVNADGIDIDSSRDIRIANVSVSAGDDAIVLKTTALYGKPRPLENVTVTNSVLTSSSAAFKIGTETHADIRNVVFSNSIIRGSNRGVGIIVRDGATVSDVLFANLTIETTRHPWFFWGNGDPFFFVVLKREAGSRIGHIRDVRISNVVARGMGTSVIQGFAGSPLSGITLSGVQLEMSHDPRFDPRAVSVLSASVVSDLTLRDVSLRWAQPTSTRWQSALVGEDLTDLSINGLEARQAPTAPDHAPALRLRNVDGARIRASVAAPGTGTFVRLEGERTQRIRLGDNDLSAAQAAVAQGPEVPQGVIAPRRSDN